MIFSVMMPLTILCGWSGTSPPALQSIIGQVPWRGRCTAWGALANNLADSGCLRVGSLCAFIQPPPGRRSPCSWLYSGELPGIFLELCSPALPGLCPPRACGTCQHRQVPCQPSQPLTSGNPCGAGVSPETAFTGWRTPSAGWLWTSRESRDHRRVQAVKWRRK